MNETKKDIIKMMRNGEPVSMADPDYATAAAVIAEHGKSVRKSTASPTRSLSYMM